MHKVDVAVVGAGPAGVALAIQLVQFDFRVRLYHQPRRYPAVEGVAERALAGLRYLGCEDTLALLHTPVSRHAQWGDEQFSGNPEWLVSRPEFDVALLRDAERAGVELCDVRVKQWQRPEGKKRTQVITQDSERDCRARFVVDARGRNASNKDRQWFKGPATVALSQKWRHSATAPQSFVCDGPNGWLWSATLDPEHTLVQCFVCSDAQTLPSKRELSAFYQAQLADYPALPEWLKNAEPVGDVFARGAHTGLCDFLIDDHSARLGDAAFATDPLAGHGIYEALGAALALGPCIQTLLRKPEDAELAKAFYRERQTQEFYRMARSGRDFYQQLASMHSGDFWAARAQWPDQQPSHPSPEAFQPVIEAAPVSVSGWITERQVLRTAEQPRGVWQLSGVPVVPLLAELQNQPQAEWDKDTYLTLANTLNCPPDALVMATRWLEAQGVLNPESRLRLP